MGRKILLVDDSKVFLEVEKAIFKRTGAEIFTASNGLDALKLAAKEKPDVILLDLMLPDITGDKVCAQIRQHPSTSEIHVIMITTKGQVEDIQRCRRAGCSDFLTKPVQHQELLAKVLDILKLPFRQAPRVLVQMEAVLQKPGEVFFGSSVDISITGMLLQAEKTLTMGQELLLSFTLESSHEIIARGRVARCGARIRKKVFYGIHFHEITPSDREFIEQFVDRHAKKPENPY